MEIKFASPYDCTISPKTSKIKKLPKAKIAVTVIVQLTKIHLTKLKLNCVCLNIYLYYIKIYALNHSIAQLIFTKSSSAFVNFKYHEKLGLRKDFTILLYHEKF